MPNTPKKGSLEYTLSRLDLLPSEKVHPHEAVKLPEVFSIMDAMNRIDPVMGERMSPIPIMVAPIPNTDEYVVLDGMHRYNAMKERGCAHMLAFVLDYTSEADLKGWDAIIVSDFDLNAVLEATTRDFLEQSEHELAAGSIVWETTLISPKEAQEKVDLGHWPFCLVRRCAADSFEATHPVLANGQFTLEQKVQLLIDLDESIESVFGGPHIFRFAADDVSLDDFEYMKAPWLLVRSRFTKDEIFAAAKDRFLLPKKTTRHIFSLRPFVQIPARFLDDLSTAGATKWQQAQDFIKKCYRERYYPEPVHYFHDVIVHLDTSSHCPDPATAKQLKAEIESRPELHFAREWAPPEQMLVSLPGPVGYSDPDVVGGFLAGQVVGHRSPEFSELYKRASDAVRWMVDPTFVDVYSHFSACLIPAPATHSMAVAALSSVRPEKKILHIVAGAFGSRWKDISDDFGQQAEVYNIKPGHPFTEKDAQAVYALLSKGGFDAVSMVLNETSTGTVYDIATIYEPVRKAERATDRDILLLVDAASAFGGMPLQGLKDADIVVMSTEKCLALPPGISIMLVREKAIQHARRMEGELNHRLGYTTSLTRIMDFHEKNQTLGTPAVPQIIMLLKTIQKVHGYVSRDGRYIPGEGLDNRYQRVAELARLDREWATKAGFSLYPQNGSVCSDTITAINLAPLDSDRIVERLKKNYRIDLSGGHRDLADDTGRKVPLIRIPHMGGMKKADLNYLLRQITRAIIDETGNEHVLMPSLRDAMEWLETDPVWG